MSFDAAPSDNLYMKGLPPGTDEEAIKSIFGVYGSVVSVKVLPSPAGVTDAAALVRMGSVVEATYLVNNAVHVASGLGSPVQIKFAHSGQGKGGGGKGSWTPAPAPVPASAISSRLYIKGLPLTMTEDSIRSVIGAYGAIVSVKVLPSPPAGAADLAAIVEMGNITEAQWMVDNLDGNIPQGLTNPVHIKYKQDGPPLIPAPAGVAFAPSMQDLRGAALPSDNLYMRGLPAGSTEQSILSIFTPYGNVASVKVLPATPGKTDVAALLRMGSLDEARWLVENLNGNIPQGLADPIHVRYADNPGKNPVAPVVAMPSITLAPVFSAPAPGPPPNSVPNTNLYMKGLPNETTETSLRAIFGPYGNVVSVKILPANQAGINNAAALVQMGSLAEAQWLVENVNNNIPEGMTAPIQIKYAANTKGVGRGVATPAALGGAWSPPAGLPAASWAVSPPPVAAAPLSQPPPAGGPSDNLYMKGFPGDTDEYGLRAVLGPYGNIVSVKMLPPPPGKSLAAALVRMSTAAEAKWLVDNLNGNIPEGMSQPVEVKYAANSGQPRGGGGGARWAPY